MNGLFSKFKFKWCARNVYASVCKDIISWWSNKQNVTDEFTRDPVDKNSDHHPQSAVYQRCQCLHGRGAHKQHGPVSDAAATTDATTSKWLLSTIVLNADIHRTFCNSDAQQPSMSSYKHSMANNLYMCLNINGIIWT